MSGRWWQLTVKVSGRSTVITGLAWRTWCASRSAVVIRRVTGRCMATTVASAGARWHGCGSQSCGGSGDMALAFLLNELAHAISLTGKLHSYLSAVRHEFFIVATELVCL